MNLRCLSSPFPNVGKRYRNLKKMVTWLDHVPRKTNVVTATRRIMGVCMQYLVAIGLAAIAPNAATNGHFSNYKRYIRKTRWALDRDANSRRPLDLLFALCDLDLWPFDLIFISGWGIVMYYPCAKFGDCTFSRFGLVVRTNRQTDTESQTPVNALLTRLSSAWVITTIDMINWNWDLFTGKKNHQTFVSMYFARVTVCLVRDTVTSWTWLLWRMVMMMMMVIDR